MTTINSYNNSIHCSGVCLSNTEFAIGCCDCSFIQNSYFCTRCKHCSSCYFCVGLGYTSNNIFCYNTHLDSFNKAYCELYKKNESYMIFNKPVSKQEYNIFMQKIKQLKCNLIFDPNIEYSKRFKHTFIDMRSNLSEDEKKCYYDLPNFDGYIFEKITGINENCKGKTVEVVFQGKKYNAILQ